MGPLSTQKQRQRKEPLQAWSSSKYADVPVETCSCPHWPSGKRSNMTGTAKRQRWSLVQPLWRCAPPRSSPSHLLTPAGEQNSLLCGCFKYGHYQWPHRLLCFFQDVSGMRMSLDDAITSWHAFKYIWIFPFFVTYWQRWEVLRTKHAHASTEDDFVFAHACCLINITK